MADSQQQRLLRLFWLLPCLVAHTVSPLSSCVYDPAPGWIIVSPLFVCYIVAVLTLQTLASFLLPLYFPYWTQPGDGWSSSAKLHIRLLWEEQLHVFFVAAHLYLVNNNECHVLTLLLSNPYTLPFPFHSFYWRVAVLGGCHSLNSLPPSPFMGVYWA